MGGDERPPERPSLRSLDVVRVPDARHGLATLVRDAEGVGVSILVPPPLDRALSLLDGSLTVSQISEALSRRAGVSLSAEDVSGLVRTLFDAYLLEGPRYVARKRSLEDAFREAPTRPATHAGGAYHRDPAKLRAFIQSECLGAAAPHPAETRAVRALIAPHMDLWRASKGYGSAYGALARGLDPGADTFVLLGTCHAGMRSPFALSAKAFETPLGALAADSAIADALSVKSWFDVFADEYQHKAEHSIEFQAVFLRYLLGAERARASTIVPILCGLGHAQVTRTDPRKDSEAESFVDALLEEVAKRPGRVVVIAGADLAHVGPRFGDPRPLDADGRQRLAARDDGTIAKSLGRDPRGFFDHVVEDLDRRRVCGVGPIYTLLRLLDGLGATRGALHHYTQHVDPEEGSIVSHASISYVATGGADGAVRRNG